MDGILIEETDYRLGRLSPAVSKESWYTPSTMEMDTLEVDTDREDALRDVPMKPVYKLNSFK